MEKFIGGRGLGAYLLFKALPAGIDPLSPHNVIIFGCGPAQGTTAPYSSRCVLNTKSPLTSIYLYSVASGQLGHHIKRAGYTAIIIRGRARELVYVIIEDESVEFRSARSFWGLSTIQAQEEMLADAGLSEASCACIGPAGERLSKMAMVATEGEKVRAFGRGGSGAVMGSKHLKGIVVSGSQNVRVADEANFKETKRLIKAAVKENPLYVENRRRFGTGADMLTLNTLGVLPTRNWQTGVFNDVNGIALTEIEEVWPRENVSCAPFCLNPCSHSIELERGPWQGIKVDGPEYETIYAFGSNCGVDRFDAIVAAEKICDDYGVDTISCGLSVSFAMECYEQGLISKADTGGIDLRFGNAEAMVETVKMIVDGEGIGVLLADGVKEASEKIPGSDRFAMHCKGMEFGGYECRGLWGQALEYAISSRGGCHHAYGLPARIPAELEDPTEVKGKGNLVKNSAITRILYDSAIMCALNISVVGLENVTEIINRITGKDNTVEDSRKIGFRVLTLERLFNLREGLTRKDDYLPQRLTEDPLPDGPGKGCVVPMDELLDEGYEAMGWDINTGRPLKETLEELDLEEFLS
jgi:aldehyde:ferredoxin oxidoreductase